MLFGAAALAVAFTGLTAFGGKTLEQQRAEINQAIQTQLETYRQEQKQACTDRVTAEAQTRYDAFVAEQEAAKSKKPAAVKKTVKKSGPKADPLPQPTPPPPSPKQEKMQQAPTNTEGKQEKMMQTPTNTEGKKSKMQKTQEGGGN